MKASAMKAKAAVLAAIVVGGFLSLPAKAGTEVATAPEPVRITEVQITQGVTTANEDAVAVLMAKLNERDLTIQELQKLNLDLQVDNLNLKEINAKLRKQLASKTAEVKRLKVECQKAAEGAYKAAIVQIKGIVSKF